MQKDAKKYWVRFILGGIIAFGLIFLFYSVARKNIEINNWYLDNLNRFAKILLGGAKFITELFGFEVTTYGKTIRIVDEFKASGIFLDRGCMGRNVMLGYAALILVFPGRFIHKLWYIPMGVMIIILVNMLRISGLAITSYCCPQYSDINHHVIFKMVAWVVIFILWVIWFNKFSPFAKRKNKKTSSLM